MQIKLICKSSSSTLVEMAAMMISMNSMCFSFCIFFCAIYRAWIHQKLVVSHHFYTNGFGWNFRWILLKSDEHNVIFWQCQKGNICKRHDSDRYHSGLVSSDVLLLSCSGGSDFLSSWTASAGWLGLSVLLSLSVTFGVSSFGDSSLAGSATKQNIMTFRKKMNDYVRGNRTLDQESYGDRLVVLSFWSSFKRIKILHHKKCIPKGNKKLFAQQTFHHPCDKL